MDFPYSVKDPFDESSDRITWFLEEIGYDQWTYNWAQKEFRFKTNEDRVKFILRWL